VLVTIVAKTRMGSGACIGGITADGRSVRLIAADMSFNAHFNLDYEVGDVWEIDGEPPADILPPHTENIVVRRKRCVGRAKDLTGLIMRHMPPREGGLETLHDGLTQGQAGGPLYIAERTGVPTFSTMFWRPDRPLVRDTAGKRIRYRYPTEDGGRTLTFIGFQEPPETLPTGSIVRVSLAHWWHPVEHPEVEMRCYLQISGWFAPPETDLFQEIQRQSDELPSDEPWPEDPQPVGALEEARHLLKRVFGYDEFRPLQAEIIANCPGQARQPGRHAHRQRQIHVLPVTRRCSSPADGRRLAAHLADGRPGDATAPGGRGRRLPEQHAAYDSYLAITQQIAPGADQAALHIAGDACCGRRRWSCSTAVAWTA
jgi:ATP-dependent DNA helicase RecQ